MKLPIFPSHPTCTLCELHDQPGVEYIGIPTIRLPDSLPPSPRTPALICIGQNPGADENSHNIPFIGRSGLVFRGGYLTPSGEPTLNASIGEHHPGLYLDGTDPTLRSLATIYITNAVRCWTVSNAKPGWKAHTKPCFPYTIDDIATILRTHHLSKRNTILCLGRPASEAILKLLLLVKGFKGSPFKHNAITYTYSARPLTVFHTYHPAYYIRYPNSIHTIERHLLGITRFLQTGRVAPISRPHMVTLDQFVKELA